MVVACHGIDLLRWHLTLSFFGGMVSCLVTAEAVNSRSHNISSIKLYLLKLTNRTLQFDLEVAFFVFI